MSILALKRRHAADLKALRDLWSLDSGDPWGETMRMQFAIAEELFRRGCRIPDEWRFRPSPLLKRGDKANPEGYPDADLAALKAHPDALRHFGSVMSRLARYLMFKGESC